MSRVPPRLPAPNGCRAITQKIMRGSEKLQPGELLVSKSGAERILLGHAVDNGLRLIRRSVDEMGFKLDPGTNMGMVQTALKNRSARVFRLDGSKSQAIIAGNRSAITDWVLLQTVGFDRNVYPYDLTCAIDREGRIVSLDYNAPDPGPDRFLFDLRLEIGWDGNSRNRAFLPLDNFKGEGPNEYRYPAVALLRLIIAAESWS